MLTINWVSFLRAKFAVDRSSTDHHRVQSCQRAFEMCYRRSVSFFIIHESNGIHYLPSESLIELIRLRCHCARSALIDIQSRMTPCFLSHRAAPNRFESPRDRPRSRVLLGTTLSLDTHHILLCSSLPLCHHEPLETSGVVANNDLPIKQ